MKFFFLFALTLSTVSFAKNDSIKEFSPFTNFEEKIGLSFLDIVANYQSYSCTATVTYNGQVRRTFTVPATSQANLAYACQLARALAEEYIQSQSLAVYYIQEEIVGEAIDKTGEGEGNIFPQ